MQLQYIYIYTVAIILVCSLSTSAFANSIFDEPVTETLLEDNELISSNKNDTIFSNQIVDTNAGTGLSKNDENKIAEIAQSALPVGAIVIWALDKVPDGYLECNGQKVNSILYPELAKLMKNVPDFRGYFLRGLGGNSEKLGVEQGDAIRNIEGSMTLVDGGILSHTGVFNSKPKRRNHIIASAPSWSSSEYEFDASRVVPTANENRPINKAVKYIIKAK